MRWLVLTVNLTKSRITWVTSPGHAYEDHHDCINSGEKTHTLWTAPLLASVLYYINVINGEGELSSSSKLTHSPSAVWLWMRRYQLLQVPATLTSPRQTAPLNCEPEQTPCPLSYSFVDSCSHFSAHACSTLSPWCVLTAFFHTALRNQLTCEVFSDLSISCPEQFLLQLSHCTLTVAFLLSSLDYELHNILELNLLTFKWTMVYKF